MWANTTTQAPSDILHNIGSELLARKEELGELLSREEAKTRAEAIGEVTCAAQSPLLCRRNGALRRQRMPSVRPGLEIEISRAPVGVVGIITPWNFPLAIPARKIAPALAFGHTILFKPSERTPAIGWALADIIARTSAPAGVFNLVMGAGEVGNAILDGVDEVSFTVSVPIGGGIAKRAVERIIPVQCEMGDKNPHVVLDDADLATAVNCAVDGAFFQTGQRCTASSRLIVTDGMHDKFVDAVAAQLRTLVVDHAHKTGTQCGPVVDQRQLDQYLRYMEIGKNEGATPIVMGELLKRHTPGTSRQHCLSTPRTACRSIAKKCSARSRPLFV